MSNFKSKNIDKSKTLPVENNAVCRRNKMFFSEIKKIKRIESNKIKKDKLNSIRKDLIKILTN